MTKHVAEGTFRKTSIPDTIKQVRSFPQSEIICKFAASFYGQFRVDMEGAQRKHAAKAVAETIQNDK